MSTSSNSGFTAKHGTDTRIDNRIRDAILSHAKDTHLSCAAAFRIVGDLGVSPGEVGKTLDLMEYRLTHCQLGLFGYQPEKKIVEPADDVPAPLAEDIQQALASERLSCRSAWAIADARSIGKLHFGGVCEAIGVKIKPCQLGAF